MRSDPTSPAEFSAEPIWPGFPARAVTFADPLGGAAGLEVAGARRGGAVPRGPEVESLHRVLEAVSRSTDAREAVEAALREGLASTGATVGSIWLFQRDGSIVRAAHSGLTRDYLRAFADSPDWPSVQRDIGRVADVLVQNDGDLPWLPEHHRRMSPLLGVNTFVVLPLSTRGLRMGSLVMAHAQPGWFRNYSIEFLRTLGELIATALDNARLLAEVRATGELHAEVLHAAHDAIVFCDPDRRITEVNPSLERLLGRVRGELIGRDLFEFTVPAAPGEDGRLFRGLIERGVPVVGVRRELLHRDGGGVPIVLNASRVTDRAGGARGVVLILREEREARASERSTRETRALDEYVRGAEKMEAVGTLAGGIAHEFNNLLTAILGQVSLALFDLPAGHPLVPGLRDCETAALRAAELTRQLLGFGRRSPLHLQPTDLRDVVAGGLPLFEQAIDPRIVIARDDHADLWRVQADSAQLAQALMHLCVNARDAMPEGGRLGISLRNETRRSPPSRRAGEYVVLEVSDTGAGMSAEVVGRIFEPFYTTKGPNRGTGLGLSFVHGIVEQHGGWVECDSRPGAGTTLRIHLPRSASIADSSRSC